MNGKIATLAFVDVETTGLDPAMHRVWDVAVTLRLPDGRQVSRQWFIDFNDLNLETADAKALEIGRFTSRYPAEPIAPYTTLESMVAMQLHDSLSGAVLVGANPQFDAAFLLAMLQRHGLNRRPWSYRLLDVEAYAAGAIGAAPPWSLDDLLCAYCIDVSDDHRHTAAGDVRAEMELFDRASALKAPK
jgi:DNA polymerase III alpha subunit (gram-positive type)